MQPTSAEFRVTMAEVYGDAGVAWVESLPSLLLELAGRWNLQLGRPFALTYNYVLRATRGDGSEVVLKAGFPSREFGTELAVLRHYGGDGAVRLLDAEPSAGAMLLERADPGATLSTTVIDDATDDEATRIAAGVMRQLWKPPPPGHELPSTSDWARGFERLRAKFDGDTGPFPQRLVEQAESLMRDLHASAGEPVVLHGDLHHDNILSAHRAPWLAIDPKGITGEREYEIGALLRNPSPWLYDHPDPLSVTERRIAIFAGELGFDRRRIAQWHLAQGVLSAWWTYEDHARVPLTFLGYLASVARLAR